MYQKELKAIKKSNRFRVRKVWNDDVVDLASNDYLGLANNKKLLKKAYNMVKKHHYNSPKASMLVNGYSKIHQKFEKKVAKLNNFEECIVVGSGFLANISMFEALCRKGDTIFVDKYYHASGILATKLIDNVIYFKHNDTKDLEEKLSLNKQKGRVLIAVEGIYSMHGDLVDKEIFNIADRYNAILIVDEAHSSGVVGKHLLGVFDLYNIIPKQNHIKMGTLGKAYGSYGAYILASSDIVSFLENRAKPIIYSTAPSLFDIALAYYSIKYIQKNRDFLYKKIEKIKQMIYKYLDIKIDGLILPIEIGDNQKVIDIQNRVLAKNFLIGAIRQPTVESAILRVIMKLDISKKDKKEILKFIKEI
jgi:8-amino-7-oxononanoate synthase